MAEQRAHADAGVGHAAWQLGAAIAELRARADAGDQDAAFSLAEAVAKQGSEEVLTQFRVDQHWQQRSHFRKVDRALRRR